MRNGILALAFGALAAACQGTTAPASTDYESLPADQVMYGMTHYMTNGGVRSAHLRSDTALIFNDSSSIQLRKVELDIFTETGTVRAELTSEAGNLDRQTNRMVARGNVILRITGENARTVFTEELHYDPTTKMVWSEVFTRFRYSDGRENTMDSFRVDDGFRNFQASTLRGPAGRLEFD